MILTIENLCKTYGEKVLFDNVNFSLTDGDKIGIVGVNGTGKSTFIKVIAGVIPADSGEVISGKIFTLNIYHKIKFLTWKIPF